MRRFLILLFILCLPLQVLTAEQYIRSSRLFLYNSPEFKPKAQVFSLKGDQITPIETKGIWFKVKVQNQEGWVNRFSLIDNNIIKTADINAIAPKPLKLKKKKKSIRIRVARTIIGIKGLRESQSTIKEKAGDYKALKQMISQQANSKAGVKFLLDYSE